MQLKPDVFKTAGSKQAKSARPPEGGSSPNATAPVAPAPIARIVFEMLLIFGLLLGADHFFFDGRAFAGLEPNPYWLPVLAMAVCYGSGIGIAAAVIATIIWTTAPGHNESGDHLQRMLSLSILPMLWIITALAVGEITSNRLSVIQRISRHRNKLKRDHHKLAETIRDLAQTNRLLQVRFATEEHTVGQAIAVAADLVDGTHANQIAGIERLIALAAQSENFTYYSVIGAQLEPMFRGRAAHEPADDLSWNDLVQTLRSRDERQHRAVFQTSRGAMILPVFDHGDPVVIGVLLINGMAEAKLTQSKVAELTQVAHSLARLADQFQRRLEPLPIRPWLLQEGNAA